MDLSSKNLSRRLSQLTAILKASWISILIIVIIIALTALDQSDTIVIDLLDKKPINFLLFVSLAIFLSLIVSHYPVYLEINRRSNLSEVQWRLKPKFFGWGFVTYEDSSSEFPSKWVKHVRNFWGLLLLVAIFYIFLVAHSRTIELFVRTENAVKIWLIAQVVLYGGYCVAMYIFIFKASRNSSPDNLRKLVMLTLALFVGIAIVTLAYTYFRGWSRPTYWWMYTLFLTAVPLYTVVRLFRSSTWLKNDLKFLKFIASGGFLSIIVVLYAHFYPFRLNPLALLLAQFIILYGLVIIPIKHYFYYRQAQVSGLGKWRRNFFIWFVPVYIPVLLVWAFISGIIGNDLHLLETIKEDKADTVGFTTFVADFDTRFSEKDTVYFIASFGGGLKANIWNQLILDRLVSYKGTNILSKTVALSGVSGGAIGHAVFTGLYATDSTRVKPRREKIRKLGEKNFLSIDLTYLLGRDLLLELVPRWPNLGKVNDRAKLAMRGYDEFVDGEVSMLDKTFRSFWGALYKKEKALGRFFPAIIGNSAGTHIQRGIACSLVMPDTIFDNTFYSSTDLLSFKNDATSLPFLYAASCTNRFPIFSPAAKVEGKGHFIDGGYFENSGMMSLLDFYNSFKKVSRLFKENRAPTVVFIQISNGKEEYLKSLLSGKPVEKKVKESPEFSSILGTVTSISFLPSYFMERNASPDPNLKTDSSQAYSIQIHLPYYISQKDIQSLFKADKVCLDSASKEAIKRSNERLRVMVASNRYGFVQPPLARLLGKQAVNYMEAALASEETWTDLNRLLNK